jgi:cold shock protein
MSRIKIRFIENKSFIKIVMCILPNINIIIMSTGTVKFFNNSKGFGFIKDGASEKEYFVHVSGLNDEIKENDEVTFDLQEGKKGLNAVNVKLV